MIQKPKKLVKLRAQKLQTKFIKINHALMQFKGPNLSN